MAVVLFVFLGECDLSNWTRNNLFNVSSCHVGRVFDVNCGKKALERCVFLQGYRFLLLSSM